MELMGKVIFIVFTIIMINYVKTFGKYDVKRCRIVSYFYMAIAIILAIRN